MKGSAGKSKYIIPRIIIRKGDGPVQRPDKNNIASNAAIVERTGTTEKRHWRYAPNITKRSFTDLIGAYNEAAVF